MFRRLFRWSLFLALTGLVVFWWVTRPEILSDEDLAGLTSSEEAGQTVFVAAGCASCHAAPGAEGEAKQFLAGGQSFPSPFGTFLAPNISQDPTDGIGSWSQAEFVTAVLKGVSPSGRHYFPAFPYTSYAKMTTQDAVDLYAFMQTLPVDPTRSQPHQIEFPFNIRRSIGGWKMLFMPKDWVVATSDPIEERGRYLVEALGHCAECHTPRNALGGLNLARWMEGAADPSGKGRIPAITPAALGWDASEIVEYLTSGFTPDFDTAGGHMVDVIENTSQLDAADREAIAAYLMILE